MARWVNVHSRLARKIASGVISSGRIEELRRNPDLAPMLRHLFGDEVIDTVRLGQSPTNADTRARDSSAMSSLASPHDKERMA